MNTEITNAINASKAKAQYDTHAKRLLSQKIILAHILVKVIDEFKDMKPEHEEKYELHRLIAALLSNQLNEQQRLAILESEYNIPINTDFGKDVNVMCNLGQGIEDRAIAETTAKIILNMYHSGYSLAQIADAVEMTETEVLDIITSASA